MNKYELNFDADENELMTLDDYLFDMGERDVENYVVENDDYAVVDTYIDELHNVHN